MLQPTHSDPFCLLLSDHTGWLTVLQKLQVLLLLRSHCTYSVPFVPPPPKSLIYQFSITTLMFIWLISTHPFQLSFGLFSRVSPPQCGLIVGRCFALCCMHAQNQARDSYLCLRIWMPRVGEGNGNPLHYSCLENPKDGRAGWAAVYGFAQSRTRKKRFSSSSSVGEKLYFLRLNTRGRQITSPDLLWHLAKFSYTSFTIPTDCWHSSCSTTLELCPTGWKIPNDSELYFIYILAAFSVPGTSLPTGN